MQFICYIIYSLCFSFWLKELSSFLYSSFHLKKRYLTYNDKYVTRYYFKYLSKSPCSHWKTGNKRAMTYKECISNMGEYYFLILKKKFSVIFNNNISPFFFFLIW